MNTEFEIKPLTSKEREKIESSILTEIVFAIFFSIILGILTYLFIYGIFMSDDLSTIIILFIFIIGVWLFFVPVIRGFITEKKHSYMLLEKNEKYCKKGYIQKKWAVYKRVINSTVFSNFYINIDNEEYSITKENYDVLKEGDYVYFEVKPPLYTEVKKITVTD